MRTNKIVLTGAPGVGKTTLMRKLKEYGYNTIKETATEVIEEQLKIKGEILPWIKKDEFQKEVAKRQWEYEKGERDTRVRFLDRGIIDGIAYYTKDNERPAKEIIERARAVEYALVLVINPMERIYENTKVRRENKEEIRIIHNEIIKAYKMMGYKIEIVPEGRVEERIRYILNKANKIIH